MEDEFLTNADAGRLLQVAPQTVKLFAVTGRLPVAARTAGGIRLYKREDVLRLKQQRTKK